jgi:hypothetical protein
VDQRRPSGPLLPLSPNRSSPGRPRPPRHFLPRSAPPTSGPLSKAEEAARDAEEERATNWLSWLSWRSRASAHSRHHHRRSPPTLHPITSVKRMWAGSVTPLTLFRPSTTPSGATLSLKGSIPTASGRCWAYYESHRHQGHPSSCLYFSLNRMQHNGQHCCQQRNGYPHSPTVAGHDISPTSIHRY